MVHWRQMDTALPRALAETSSEERRPLVYRHSLTVRVTHWLSALALVVLVMSGLQIFNAAPYLDASDKSDPHHRVLEFTARSLPGGATEGVTILFGHALRTTHLLGYTDDGQGGETNRAFPGWLTLPGYQALADGRRWHFFFAWIFTLCGAIYIIVGLLRRDLQELVLRRSDLPKLWPMQAYYLRLRSDPPSHGKYNPLQKLAYTLIIFVFAPLVVISGLALSPGIDAIAGPLTTAFGGRQFARLWHFVFMLALLGFFAVHLALVTSTGVINNMRSMILGTYRLGKHDGVGP
ncbi:MAG: cytochrome b/b6 domain-containing protein [Candidatus Eremiobacteraeota bacterium]|nr:cytochrome b/b6 domain-containing protein [Candidatus Eremiobacteraeota bacterium]MBV9647658.1 cytochrome b/b6 domain-containing protein [Candidatus Eremiobacteraeota bacterium]